MRARFPRSGTTSPQTLKSPPPPPLHPATHEPIGPEALAPLFPMELIKQEVSAERRIDIPDEVRGVPHLAADAAHPRDGPGEGARDARAHLLQVRGRVSERESQAQHRDRAGLLQQAGRREADRHGDGRGSVGIVARLRLQHVRDRGQGLHGQHLVPAEAVSPVVDAGLGGTVVPSPSRTPMPGARCWSRTQGNGSLGIAISEAVEDAATREETKYSLGSVLNHVLLHQTVIGQEAIAQMEMADAYPDVVIGCAGRL